MVHVVYLGAAANGGSWRRECGGGGGAGAPLRAPTSSSDVHEPEPARRRLADKPLSPFMIGGLEEERERRPSKLEIFRAFSKLALCDVTRGAYMSLTLTHRFTTTSSSRVFLTIPLIAAQGHLVSVTFRSREDPAAHQFLQGAVFLQQAVNTGLNMLFP